MTELIHHDRLRLIAVVMDRPPLPPRRPIPVLQWTIDSATGRPVASWVLAGRLDRPPAPR